MLTCTEKQRIARNVETLQRALLWADRIRKHVHDEDPENLVDACVAYDKAREGVLIPDLVEVSVNWRTKWNWIQTYKSKQFFPMDPRPEDIDLLDITHSLSNVCRFNGHVKSFYSVAQHCVLVSNLLADKELRLWGLFHDAAEAYLSDIPRPIKPLLPEYGVFEERLLKAIAVKFNLVWPMPDEVKRADLIALATEKRDLMDQEPAPWSLDVEPDPRTIEPVGPTEAKAKFINTYNGLTGAL